MKVIPQIWFVWSDSTVTLLYQEHKITYPIINVDCHVFSADELRSLRNLEVCMLPIDNTQLSLAAFLQKEMNKYGIVSIIKYLNKDDQ